MPEYKAVVSMRDSDNYKASKRLVTDAVDITAASAVFQAAVTILKDVTKLRITKWTVSDTTVETDTVTASANRAVGATFTGLKPDGEFATLYVPDVLDAVFNQAGEADITNVDLKAFLDLYVVGVGDLTLSDGEQVTEWVKGVRNKD